MRKRLIRLTESDLHRIVRKSVNEVLNGYGSLFYKKYKDPNYEFNPDDYDDDDDEFNGR